MKNTVFYNFHKNLGAKMAEFAGFNMPIEYPKGVLNEHAVVRSSVGIFDVSHMGNFLVSGKNAAEFLEKVTTNDIASLVPGRVQYSCFPNGNGGIVDDVLVYKLDKNKYFLVPNASNIEKDWNWLMSQNSEGAVLENLSDQFSQVAVQGPKSIDVLQSLTEIDLSKIKYYHFVEGNFAGKENIIISATGYTGEPGFEIYFKNDEGPVIWTKIMEAGQVFGIEPIGLAARDTLRLEMGYCLYGNDIDDTTSPIEAGLSWIVKFRDGKNFIDKDFLFKQKIEKPSRNLRGFEMVDKGIPRHDYQITDKEGNIIGKVTSGTMSPSLKIGIGMGYINREFSEIGSEIFVNVRNKMLKAKVIKLPFYKK